VPRAIWKGAISFGLVHVPVALYPASGETGIDFDWLDKKTMDPVGYKRVNKRTGKEIVKENIVKGVKQGDNEYVVLSDDEIKKAYPKTMQTIEIETFVKAAEISFPFLDRPYFLEPVGKGEKVYALLREAMLDAGVIGIARVVMHTKEHLAALIPAGPALMLNTLRWAADLRPIEDLTLPAAGKKSANLKDSELKMAKQLITDMTEPWKPEQYEDRFADAIMTLVKQRVDAGKTETVQPLEADEGTSAPSNVVDLAELLSRSLGQRKGAAAKTAAPAAKKAPAKKTPAARKRA
jgi:DNA end-binding protein Ku